MSEHPSIAELLERLNTEDESHDLEAKRSETDVGKSTLETISAFSNEPGLGGGYILFGVAEGEGAFAVLGVRNPKKLASSLASLSASSFNRAIRPRVWTESVGGAAVVAAHIPEAAAAEKPVYIKAKGLDHGTFRRVGSTDQRCTEDDLRVLFRVTSQPYEDELLTDATEDDLASSVIASYRRQLLDENPSTELRDASEQQLVQAVGGARLADGRRWLTVAGVLLFGTRLAHRRLFPQIRVDYIRVQGTRWVPDADRRYDAIEIRDPLLQAFRRSYQAVLDDLPRSFSLEGAERRDRTRLPEQVVREALVNAICHRDYAIPSAIQIIRFQDRIEIRNPGRALVSDEQLGQPGSYPRNPRIADLFREMRLAENKGTGIEAMRRAMRDAELAPPSSSRTRARITSRPPSGSTAFSTRQSWHGSPPSRENSRCTSGSRSWWRRAGGRSPTRGCES